MNNVSRSLPGLVMLAVALGIGFAAGAAVLLAVNALLPPFRREDDDTLREFVPVVLAYATMAGTTALVIVFGWRRRRSRPTVGSRDAARR
jgi:hypothetical protein